MMRKILDVLTLFEGKGKFLRKLYCALLGFSAFSFYYSQISPATQGPVSPTNAQIDAVLQGPNLQIINSNLKSGDRNIQIRTFTNGSNANFGMDKGVVFLYRRCHICFMQM